MPLSGTELNRVANDITSSAMTSRVHSANPGTNGTTARIGTAEADLAAADWSAGSGGDSDYDADAEYGVLDSGAERTVSHYSIWRGNAFVGSEALDAAVVVAAGGTFKINTGTISVQLSSS